MGFREPIYAGPVPAIRASVHDRPDPVVLPPPPRALPERPTRHGHGPAQWSTCTALEPFPPVIWDTNHFYRLLGIPWPYRIITRAVLREAYRVCGGPENQRLTYAFHVLLDPVLRAAYNATPLEDVWMEDEWWQDYLKSEAALESTRRLARGHFDGCDVEGILDEWGLRPVEDDAELPPDQDFRELSERLATLVWPWGYYLWRSNCDDTRRLAKWQELLLRAFARAGLRRNLSVGFVGRSPSSWVEVEVDSHTAILLNESVEPNEELAVQVVSLINK